MPAAAHQPTTMGSDLTYGLSNPSVVTGTLWIVSAVALLTSAMFATASIAIYDLDRALALAAQYVVWAISAGILFSRLRQKLPIRQIKSTVRKWVIAFLAGMTLSLFFVWIFDIRSDINVVFIQTAALAYMTLPFFIFYLAAKSTNVGKAVMLTCHVIVALCTVSILADFTGVASFESALGRYFGFMGDQAAWVLTLPLLVYFCAGRFALAAVAAVGLALTASRAPALCVAAALLLLPLFSRGRRFQYTLTFAAMALVALFHSEIFETLFGRIRTTDFASSDRMATARLGLKIFSDSPIYGAGYNSFTYYFPYKANRFGELPTQTSTFVQILSDGGLLVFMPYIAFVVLVTFAGIHLMRRSRMIADSDVINGVIAWLLAMLWVNQSATWLVVGSYVGPLVLGMAGVVVGCRAKMTNAFDRGTLDLNPNPLRKS